MKPPISEQTRNRWRSILPSLGIAETFLGGKHGPCPICGGKDRFRFDDKEGRGTFYCSGSCGAGDGVKLLMLKTGRPFAEVADMIRERLPDTSERASPAAPDLDTMRRNAEGLWNSAQPIFGDDAAHYLASRAITQPYPFALRFHPSVRVLGHPTRRTLPAMLALVRDPSGQPVTVHRTYLEQGRKAAIESPRMMMPGPVPKGSAIRLADHDGRLGVAEGIETAMWVRQRFGIACWALIDADKLKQFVIPDDVRELHIYADKDRNHVGQAAAEELARRACVMLNGPSVVEVHYPALMGTDWADPQPDDVPGSSPPKGH